MELDPQTLIGLSEAEAFRRLAEEGYNELPASGRRSVWAIAFEVAREPMFLMLVACGVVYLLMGGIGDAALLLSFVFVVMGITIVQERRTERALDALKDLSAPRALVIREGRQRRVAGREVARGDLIIVAEGDRIPSDAVLLQSINLSVDESLLTGESAPVRKIARVDASETSRMAPPGGDDLPFVFSGSLVVRGQGIAEVIATGAQTELGKIGKALEGVKPEKTLLQKETGRLVRNLAILGLSLCALVVVVYGLTRGNNAHAWGEGVLAGITMAMATLPEEFPVVLTVFLALGAWRISQHRVLTRRMPAIETLGAATVLCVDKTGTLTLNQMSVRRLWAAQNEIFNAGEGAQRLPEAFHGIIEYGILASKRDPFDPMEKALRDVGESFLQRTEHLHDNWTLIHEYPLSPKLLALSHVWKSPDGSDYVVARKRRSRSHRRFVPSRRRENANDHLASHRHGERWSSRPRRGEGAIWPHGPPRNPARSFLHLRRAYRTGRPSATRRCRIDRRVLHGRTARDHDYGRLSWNSAEYSPPNRAAKSRGDIYRS